MLNSITIKNLATFDESGVEISDLRKVNFIYGVNASGKTTITKVIAQPDNPDFNDCSLVWLGEVPIKSLVYNKDFRELNFGKEKINGVFTLGQATKEEVEEIMRMQEELDEIKVDGIKKKKSLDKLVEQKDQIDNDFKEIIWTEIYKKHEVVFREAFRGVMQKELFKGRLLKENQNNKVALQTFEELINKAKTIFTNSPTSIQEITPIEKSKILEIESHNIWQKKIIGKADVEIARLIQKLDLNDWVNEGIGFLQDNETCPFCQQPTITRGFRDQLEKYFDETFLHDTKQVKELSNEYNGIAQDLINLLQGIENEEKAKKDTKLNIESFSAILKTLTSQFLSNQVLLQNKTKEPSRSVDLVSVKNQLDDVEKLIIDANTQIKAHNSIVANYAKEKLDLIEAIWKYLLIENGTKIHTYLRKSNGLQKGVAAISEQHKGLQIKWMELNKEIQKANRNVTSVQPSVDEINNTLTSYGFLNFRIVPSPSEENHYQIQREDGTLAEVTLSEGEITFITFLYFLQLAKGSMDKESITEERILVIDDPISSLDSNVLFVVSSLLKELIKKIKKGEGSIKQIILLTHNVYFHKEVSFIDGRTAENGDTFYWILKRKNKVSEVHPYGMKNPIHTSYELLWQELKSKDNSGITTQNIMRRIIESYFKLLGKYIDDDLIKRFPSIPDQEICRSLVCWINEGSHGIPDDLYVEQQDSTVDKYHEVFKNIFTYTRHDEHYKMMMNG
jgi:wobble nucleotide-excising tRNase